MDAGFANHPSSVVNRSQYRNVISTTGLACIADSTHSCLSALPGWAADWRHTPQPKSFLSNNQLQQRLWQLNAKLDLYINKDRKSLHYILLVSMNCYWGKWRKSDIIKEDSWKVLYKISFWLVHSTSQVFFQVPVWQQHRNFGGG